ncbi:AAA family ATPase [Rhodopseudomonas sp. HC1]|uniref:AAA family ATPase n=1 Tax=Rhodopseudomonas infernalis TaxID=2897386 RepID=UPI001EE8F366|nr:AAA family ATPase [Rhodopseudomonas infernalis]MCG6205829.1 AAA family ATPase [Rhodopseudomonas infernalis]
MKATKRFPGTKSGFSAARAAQELADIWDAEQRSEIGEEAVSTDRSEDSASRPRERPGAMDAIISAAFEAAVPRKMLRRLLHGQALAATLVVPAACWVSPMADYLAKRLGTRWLLDRYDREADKGSLRLESDETARILSRGRCVLGIAPDADFFPEALRQTADLSIVVPPPNGAVVHRAIARFLGRSPGIAADGVPDGLGLHHIVAALRPGSGGATILRRLSAPAAAKTAATERVPDLATAVEYGAARLWGLDLARDIADFRAGRIAWRDLDRGICLHSPPGCGKSWFPKILAKASGVPLVSTSVGDWFAGGNGYLDAVIKQARQAFADAADQARPVAILHLDEIDALPNRSTMSDRGREWWTAVVTDVLTRLDSTLTGRDRVVVVGSTNDIARVDAALLRPGRLERVVEIAPPDHAGIVNILRFHLGDEVPQDLSSLAPLLEGATAADLMQTVRAARRIARHAGRALTLDDLRAATLPFESHPPQRLFRMAVHEAGHVVAAMALGVGIVAHVVLRRDGASGGQIAIDYADDDILTRRGIEDRVTVALAARTAEELLIGAMSTGSGGGAESDLGAATIEIAALHASYGLRGTPLFLADAGPTLLAEVKRDPILRARVSQDLLYLEKRAAELIEANRALVLTIARRLAETRYLDRRQIDEIVKDRLVVSDRTPSGGSS